MVRNICEIKKLIDQGKENEITKEEIEMLTKVIGMIKEVFTPLMDALINAHGKFLNIMEEDT